MANIKLSAFADEYSSSLDEQISVLNAQNISFLEIRNVDGKNVADLTIEEAKEVKKKLDAAGIRVSSIGSPLGKIDIIDDFDAHMKKAENIYRIANILECKNIRMFSFYNKTNVEFDKFEKTVIERLTSLLDLADKYGVKLCHENEALIYGESPESCLKLAKFFKGRLAIVFDMGNYVLDGYDPLKGYELLKGYIEYFHIKDSLYAGAIVPAGKGEARIKEILALAKNDQTKDFYITIEPHLESFGGLNALVGKAFVNPYKFKTQQDAFLAGVEGTKYCIKEAEKMKTMKKDNLMVKAFATREEMGKKAAKDAAACFKKLLEEKEEINVIFAAAPSQNDVLRSLVADKTIEWNRINAYHMDEYIGLDKNAPQGFANFLRAALFDLVPFKSVNCIDVSAKDPEKEAERYSKILMEHKPDAVVLGIGENGHIAFNDPGVADFDDPKVVKPVPLDDMCRNQQVHDGCFAKLEDVPQYALTLTIPTLYNAPHLFCVVPVATKAQAVYDTVNGPINEKCPASIMRKHGDATLYLDADSSKLLKL